jgi:SAM-dependent methyltransferase
MRALLIRLWPLPALLCWGLGWATLLVLTAAQLPPAMAFALGVLACSSAALLNAGFWRRAMSALGFPLSALVLGAAGGVPAWLWLLAAVPLMLLYPVRAWRDAPLFPTPAHALAGVNALVASPARVLDAGCGLGHGLLALRSIWPHAQISGVEWSRPLAWAARMRCRWAQVERGDMWAADWSACDLVYLFQRPESLPRAMAKARREMRPGSWLMSLEFAAAGETADACLGGGDSARKPVWMYRIGPTAAAQNSTESASGR